MSKKTDKKSSVTFITPVTIKTMQPGPNNLSVVFTAVQGTKMHAFMADNLSACEAQALSEALTRQFRK